MTEATQQSEKELTEKLYKLILQRMKMGLDKSAIVQELIQIGMEQNDAKTIVDTFYDDILDKTKAEEFTFGSLIPATIGGVLAALIGGALWGIIVVIINYEIGYMATGIGFLCGMGVILFSKGKRGIPFQIIATICSFVGIIVGKYIFFYHSYKEIIQEKYGVGLACKLSIFSRDTIRYFIEEALVPMLGGFDVLWVGLAIVAAWSIPRSMLLVKREILIKQLISTLFLVALIFSGLLFYFSKDKVEDVSKYSISEYTSNEYAFNIKVPNDWGIVLRKDFEKVGGFLVDSEAEIALISSGKDRCYLLPELLDNYGADYDLESLREAVLFNIFNKNAGDQSLKIIDNRLISNRGFEIQYCKTIDGVQFKYMVLYNVYDMVGIQLFVWTFMPDADNVFSDIRKISDNIKFIKTQ